MRSQFLPSPKLQSHNTHTSDSPLKDQQNSAINIKYSKQIFQSLRTHLAQNVPRSTKKLKNPSFSSYSQKDPLQDPSSFNSKKIFSSSFNSINPNSHDARNSQLISVKSNTNHRPNYLEPEVFLNKFPNKHYFLSSIRKSQHIQRYEFPFIRSPKDKILLISKNTPSRYSLQYNLLNKSPYFRVT